MSPIPRVVGKQINVFYISAKKEIKINVFIVTIQQMILNKKFTYKYKHNLGKDSANAADKQALEQHPSRYTLQQQCQHK